MLFAKMSLKQRLKDEIKTVALTPALFSCLEVYNSLCVLRRFLGEAGLLRLLLSPLPEEWHSGKVNIHSNQTR